MAAALQTLLALAVWGGAAGSPDDAPEEPGVELPAGPAADAWERALAELPKAEAPGAPPEPWPAWPGGPAWAEEEPWARWVALVRAEAAAERPDPKRRAALALLAAEQGRSDDAWRHFARAAAEPGLAAALLPRLFPGASAEEGEGAPAAPGLPPPLPGGARLRPLLPPPTPGLAKGLPDLRAVQAHGVQIGAAVLRVRLSVESDGVEIRLSHLSGGPARLVLEVPLPLAMRAGSVHVDWQKREGPAAPLLLELEPGTEELAVWVRFARVRPPWPEGVPAELGAVVRNGIALEVDEGDPRTPRLARAAAALGELLGVPARLALRGAPGAGGDGLRELVIRLPASLDPEVAEKELVSHLSRAEGFVLGEIAPEDARGR